MSINCSRINSNSFYSYKFIEQYLFLNCVRVARATYSPLSIDFLNSSSAGMDFGVAKVDSKLQHELKRPFFGYTNINELTLDLNGTF